MFVTVPAVVIPFCILCVHRHPEPVDDCPCFEDAIAFMSVVMGEFLTRWYMSRHGYDNRFFKRVMAGKAYGSLPDMWTWWSIAAAKLVVGECQTSQASCDFTLNGLTVGVLAIFAWRIFAKFLLHRILPPSYRFLSQLMTLPQRRYYTPATDYTNMPPDKGLRAFPSVLDLPGMVELEVDGVSTAASRRIDAAAVGRAIKLRAGRGNKGSRVGDAVIPRMESVGLGMGLEELGGRAADVDVVKHYDADGEWLSVWSRVYRPY